MLDASGYRTESQWSQRIRPDNTTAIRQNWLRLPLGDRATIPLGDGRTD